MPLRELFQIFYPFPHFDHPYVVQITYKINCPKAVVRFFTENINFPHFPIPSEWLTFRKYKQLQKDKLSRLANFSKKK
jgi:hypothetical protein